MALAKLCVDLKAFNHHGKHLAFSFHGLIVDHKARDDSDVEAENVKIRLQNMGTIFLN